MKARDYENKAAIQAGLRKVEEQSVNLSKAGFNRGQREQLQRLEKKWHQLQAEYQRRLREGLD